MDISYESLNENIKVCINKEHRFGTDAFLLAKFTAPKHKDIVCDLCTGCGIIPFILSRDFTPKKIYGVELQKEAYELFMLGMQKSTTISELFPICGDLKTVVLPETVDVVTCNPPYKTAGSGIVNSNEARQIARHEIACTIDDVCMAAYKMLRFGGRLTLCQRPERLADIIVAMRNYNIEPKNIKFVSSDGNNPWLVLIEGKKGAKSFLKVSYE